MGKPWEEQFDFYREDHEDGPLAVMLDLAAVQHAPLASHPVRFTLEVPMRQPLSNGLRSREESAALFALEDRLLPALEALETLYVGRFMRHGTTTYCLYASPSLDGAAVEHAVESTRGEYEVRVKCAEDSGWSTYLDVLYPDSIHVHSMTNRRVLAALAERGDQHELPRELDHMALFPNEGAAGRAAQALTARGFTVQAPQPPAEGEKAWTLSFKRVDTLANGRADEVVSELLRIVEAHAGTYDGWGCVVQANKRPGLLSRLFGRRS